MLNWFSKFSFVSLGLILVFSLGVSSTVKAESKPDSLDSEAKVIERLKNLAASQAEIAKPVLAFPNHKIDSLEKVDQFLGTNIPTERPSLRPNLKLVLRLRDRRVLVYEDNQVKASYPVAVGKSGWETPKGKFQVKRLERNPSWQNPWTGKVSPPGENSPIGSRWIGFWSNGKDEIGFHGTPNEGSIGQAASHGCVRMLNRDVKALFELVSLGTSVEVVP